jgi:predicted short-subunit dehydrogenase-like oxidoreductase (DUF2520 family)
LPQAKVTTTQEVVADKDLVVLSIPDDVLVGLVDGLAKTKALSPGTFVVHLSGRYGTEILAPLTDAGCLPLALHPAMTFTGTEVDLARLVGCPFGVTAPEQLRPVAQALVLEMGGEPIWIAPEQRPLYHAALSFGANFLMTVVNQSADLLGQAGVDEPQAFLKPLLSAALENALRSSDDAQTGPVVRADVATVTKHVEVLFERDELVAQTYIALARLTASRAFDHGRLSATQLSDLLAVLAK